MANDNTSAVNDSKASDTAIVDQKTLDEALNKTEPVKEVEDSTEETETQEPTLTKKEEAEEDGFLNGKYKSKEQIEKGFRSLQERARKAEEELKALKKQQEEQAFKDFSNMDYEEQVKFLAQQERENKNALEKIYGVLTEQAQQEDASQLDNFIKSEPLIAETGLEDEFRLLATHPKLQQYTIESIFKTILKPKIEKLMGTKITVKERKILSDAGTPQVDEFSPDSIAKMSPQEYAKNREKILRASGVKI